ncbi:MAG: hypothetical protein KF716_31735 [Anaerolineae bacterium]|nr:hypothetical protein [Anaerolineae bacterium]
MVALLGHGEAVVDVAGAGERDGAVVESVAGAIKGAASMSAAGVAGARNQAAGGP